MAKEDQTLFELFLNEEGLVAAMARELTVNSVLVRQNPCFIPPSADSVRIRLVTDSLLTVLFECWWYRVGMGLTAY